MSDFARFTDRARRVVVLTQEEARLLGHNYLGSEHLLLGMLHEREGVAGLVLDKAGLTLEAAREQIQFLIGQGEVTPAGNIPFTPRAKKIIELSLREALMLGHSWIGTEHLLLGMLREGDGVGIRVLDRLNIDKDALRASVMGMLLGTAKPRSPVQRELLTEVLVKRAEALISQGTLVFEPGKKVAYAFVVPIEARDDLAEILDDIARDDDD